MTWKIDEMRMQGISRHLHKKNGFFLWFFHFKHHQYNLDITRASDSSLSSIPSTMTPLGNFHQDSVWQLNEGTEMYYKIGGRQTIRVHVWEVSIIKKNKNKAESFKISIQSKRRMVSAHQIGMLAGNYTMVSLSTPSITKEHHVYCW